MHKIAEYGFAAHWKYKEGKTDTKDKKLNDETNKFAWLRQLLEWQKDTDDAGEFLEKLKVELFSDEVFVFTPKGDVIDLPAGSTSVDFAYAIHSAIGNKMTGAKINGKLATLETKLNNGDIIEIVTSSTIHGPSRDWLKIAKSPQARNKINQWFKKEERDENVIRGKENLEREVKKSGLTAAQIIKPEWIDIVLKKYNFGDI
jgi:GTP pyrophosphokinase